jgi:DNA polymerase-3 subunit beta
MQLSIDRNTLLKSLTHIQGVVERRNTIPILSNVKLEAKANKLSLTATDMDLAISEDITADVQTEGTTTVPAHTLHDIIRKLQEGEKIEISLKNEKLLIKAKACKFSLPCLSAEQFPTISADDSSHNFNITIADLLKLIDKAKFAISTEETRYYLNGIFLHHAKNQDEKDVLRAVATDGHRLARVEVALPEGAKDIPSVIIPRKAIMEIKKILDEEDKTKTVTVALSDTKIKITGSSVVLVSKLIDGTFPDYEKVIPSANNIIMGTKVKPLCAAIDRVSTIASDKTRGVKILLSNNKLTLSANNVDIGDAQEELDVKFDAANDIETGFNSKYLLEMASVLEGEDAEFFFSDSMSPTIVKDSADLSSLYVIMPMRI